MARKKIVFVIVEGPSDEEALGVVLSKLYDSNTVYIQVMHCDITTEKGVNSSNVIEKIAAEVKEYAKKNHFTQNDFKEIIHIADMDGAYIPDKSVREDLTLADTEYSTTEIRTNSKAGIERRNAQKRGNLSKLYSTKSVWKLQYRVFYMSCNLDHVLYDKLNTSDQEKENDSYEFAKKYKDRPQDFLKFIGESDFSVMTDYKTSWDYIRVGLHSLERHTNLGLCFLTEQDDKSSSQDRLNE